MTDKSPVYALCLALIILIAPAVADDAAPGESGSGSTPLGSDDPTINVLVTPVEFGNFAFGDNTKEVSGFIHVTTDHDVKLQAAESGGDGKMSSSAGTLENALKVGIDDFNPVEICGGQTVVSNTISSGSGNHVGKFTQKVVPADPVGSYTITVTFTTAAA